MSLEPYVTNRHAYYIESVISTYEQDYMVRCTIKERDIPFTFFHNGLFGYSFVVSKGEVLLFSSNKEK